MFYETGITIPKNTLQTAPVLVDLPIHAGVIQRVEIAFPAGCAGLAHVQVLYWNRQLWPSNPDSYFSGDGQQIQFDEDLQIVDAPYTLRIVGWNEDDTFPHTPIVRVQVTPTDKTLSSIVDRLMLGPSGPVKTVGGG